MCIIQKSGHDDAGPYAPSSKNLVMTGKGRRQSQPTWGRQVASKDEKNLNLLGLGLSRFMRVP